MNSDDIKLTENDLERLNNGETVFINGHDICPPTDFVIVEIIFNIPINSDKSEVKNSIKTNIDECLDHCPYDYRLKLK